MSGNVMKKIISFCNGNHQTHCAEVILQFKYDLFEGRSMNKHNINRMNYQKLASIIVLIVSMFFYSVSSQANPVLKSVWTDEPLQVDGRGTDDAWDKAPVLTTHDLIADIDIQIQSLYSRKNIYMLVTFADATENRLHKLMHWNETKQRYTTGVEREDIFIFKWNMLPTVLDISLSSNIPYKADIWYWKASRTDHAGYADDKMQTYKSKKSKNTRLFISKNGKYFYLSRKGDKGKPAYIHRFYSSKSTETVDKYDYVKPEGSRADVRAKGFWQDGVWTIEFQRALNTGHFDDLQFNTASSYFFGVSRYEIAGRKENKQIEQPKFGAGEVNKLIELRFIQK